MVVQTNRDELTSQGNALVHEKSIPPTPLFTSKEVLCVIRIRTRRKTAAEPPATTSLSERNYFITSDSKASLLQ